jgi:hypothetical protein
MKLAVQIKPCCSNRAAQTATILKSKLEKTVNKENPGE